MKAISGTRIAAFYKSSDRVAVLWRDAEKVWEAVRSCFGSGRWRPLKQWSGKDRWKNR